MTIQTKAVKAVVCHVCSVDENLNDDCSNQVYSIEQYFPLLGVVHNQKYYAVHTFESVAEILKCEHSISNQHIPVMLMSALSGGSNLFICR